MLKLCAKYFLLFTTHYLFPSMYLSCPTFKIKVTAFAVLHLLFFVCIRWISFADSFHTGKESGTLTYNASLKYFKTAKHMSIFGMEVMLPTEENADGTLHRFTRKRQVEVSCCKWLRYGLLYGILYQSCTVNATNKPENHKLL